MTPSVREAFISALATRAAKHEGALRVRLEARLAELKSEAQTSEVISQVVAVRAPSRRGPLGQLADGLAARYAVHESAPAARSPSSSVAASTYASAGQRELTTLRRFRREWSRLSSEQRLRQAMAQVPTQAGPLNSHHLVHRALETMQDVSPAYLQRFVSHVDALLALEQQQAPPSPKATRPESRRKGRG